MPITDYYFYRFLVNDQVFFKSAHSFALVNLKPIVPGHVLVVSNRVVKRLKDLTDTESQDYMRTIRSVSKFIEYHYKADALNIAIQDGPSAGQSIPHLHTHIIPRHETKNFGDRIYDMIDKFDVDVRKSFLLEELQKLSEGPDPQDVEWVPDDDERKPRSSKEMREEAELLRQKMKEYTDGAAVEWSI